MYDVSVATLDGAWHNLGCYAACDVEIVKARALRNGRFMAVFQLRRVA